MKEVIKVEMDRANLIDAISQHLQRKGYSVKEGSVKFEQNFFLNSVAGVSVQVLNSLPVTDDALNMPKKAKQRLCVCKDKTQMVYVDSISGEGTEFESLDGFYCPSCNSFWREP